jgi:hypothetical protein
MNTTPCRNSVNRSSAPIILILLTCFALFQRAEAVNTATGAAALLSNTTGAFNTANGAFALFTNTIGIFNTANGAFALLNNTTGVENTASGYRALSGNATGVGNTAYGSQALVQAAGDNNIALGAHAGFNISTGSNNIHIGNVGAGNESGTVRIGDNNQTKTFIVGINGVKQGSPTAVFINTLTGQLGTTPPASARRYKKGIKPMNTASEVLLALKPISFNYKSDNTKNTAIWSDCRRRSGREPRPGCARRERRDLHRALRRSERDVTQ